VARFFTIFDFHYSVDKLVFSRLLVQESVNCHPDTRFARQREETFVQEEEFAGFARHQPRFLKKKKRKKKKKKEKKEKKSEKKKTITKLIIVLKNE
jgi:hypothetical protein